MSVFKSAAKRAVKRAVIQTGLEAIALSGAAKLARGAAGQGLIFTLHHVQPQSTERFQPNALLTITPEFLAIAIETALGHGLTPVPLRALPALLADESDKRRFVCFTLDDGYRDNAQYATPVFERYQIPYTIFIAEGFINRTRSAWWETVELVLRGAESLSFDFGHGAARIRTQSQLEKMDAFDRFAKFVATSDEDQAVAAIDALAKAHGIDAHGLIERLTMDEKELKQLIQRPLVSFGAHTRTHVNVKRVSEARLMDELNGSAAAVAKITGARPEAFCFPYGGHAAVGPREVSAAASAGFKLAVTTQPGTLGAHSLARITGLPRVSLNGYYQRRRYVSALISGLPFRVM